MDEPIEVHEEHIRETLQYFFDHTQWGEMCGGHLDVEPEEWDRILEDFGNFFTIDPVTREYVISEEKLYSFINDQVYQLVENTMMRMADMGIVTVGVDKNGEIVFTRVDNGKDQ
jgi:hypothetical protein